MKNLEIFKSKEIALENKKELLGGHFKHNENPYFKGYWDAEYQIKKNMWDGMSSIRGWGISQRERYSGNIQKFRYSQGWGRAIELLAKKWGKNPAELYL